MFTEKLTQFLLTLLCVPAMAWSQPIDLGRGEEPVFLPSDYSESRAYPLVILLHGYGADSAMVEAIWGFTSLIEEFDFIYATPSGNTDQSDSQFWNATPACCNFYGATVDDASYLFFLIEAIKETYNIDANRVYVLGDSNGGFMALELAYRFPDTIAASVSIAGASHIELRSAPDAGVHVLQIHGTADTSILYAGGVIEGFSYPGAQATALQWAEYNNCSTNGRLDDFRDLSPTIPGFETEVSVFDENCRQDGSAELWTVEDGVHRLGNPVSESVRLQLIEWLFAKSRSGWPANFSGVIPPKELQLSVNNIGNYNDYDGIIYSCIRVVENGQESAIDGISRFDIGFSVVVETEGRIQLVKSRPFNADNSLNRNLELPDCSGTFEITSGIYSDIIQAGSDVFRLSFQLVDAATLELELLELAPYQ